MAVLQTIRREGVAPSALIIVHASSISEQKTHLQLAEAGAWLEYDNIGSKAMEEHVRLIKAILQAGLGHRLLLSHDAGWYQVGNPDGGKAAIRPYTALSDQLIPALKTDTLQFSFF